MVNNFNNFQEDPMSKDKGKGKGKGGKSNSMREGNVRSIYIAESSEVIVCEGTRGSGGEGSGVSTSGAVPFVAHCERSEPCAYQTLTGSKLRQRGGATFPQG